MRTDSGADVPLPFVIRELARFALIGGSIAVPLMFAIPYYGLETNGGDVGRITYSHFAGHYRTNVVALGLQIVGAVFLGLGVRKRLSVEVAGGAALFAMLSALLIVVARIVTIGPVRADRKHILFDASTHSALLPAGYFLPIASGALVFGCWFVLARADADPNAPG